MCRTGRRCRPARNSVPDRSDIRRADRLQIRQSVRLSPHCAKVLRMLVSWDVEVSQDPDGDIVIRQQMRFADGSGGEGRCEGPSPTPEEPLGGPGTYEPGVRHVQTVAAIVDRVVLTLSDGSEHSPELREVEGGIVRWFRHETPDVNTKAIRLTAIAATGEEVARVDPFHPTHD